MKEGMRTLLTQLSTTDRKLKNDMFRYQCIRVVYVKVKGRVRGHIVDTTSTFARTEPLFSVSKFSAVKRNETVSDRRTGFPSIRWRYTDEKLKVLYLL